MSLSVDQKVAVLHEFHEWRQDNGHATAHWDTAVQHYEDHLRSEERGGVISELRSLALAPGVDGARVNELLDKLA